MKLTISDLDYSEDARIDALEAAMKWFALRDGKVKIPPLLVLVNMREPSYRKRMYVYDTNTNEFIRNHHTTHGSGSCTFFNKACATKFSNTPDSHQTSLGMMKIIGEYIGKHGRSLRLAGLDPHNSNVEGRYIVIHKANYVTDSYILNAGYAGCSWGCFATDPAIHNSLADTLRKGTMLYCHY